MIVELLLRLKNVEKKYQKQARKAHIYYFEQVLFSKFHGNLLFSSSRLHPSSCSVIGSVEDRSVLMTIHDIYFNTVWCFEQVLSSKFPENLSFSSSRLHPSSCSVIGSLEDGSILMDLLEVYFDLICYFEQVL